LKVKAGWAWTTENLAGAMRSWLDSGQDISLMVGGPEGLAESVKQAAQQSWSLSKHHYFSQPGIFWPILIK
jgi:23S rRNA (pseudouridine1915-N3)-methyltransferase